MSLSLLTLVALFLLFAFFGWTVSQRNAEGKPTIFFKRKDYLLSRAERDFFVVLKPIVERHGSVVFPKVRLEDVIRVAGPVRNKFAARNRIKSRHIDFLICTEKELKPLLAIELDDSSHDAPHGIEYSRTKTDLFAKADMPLLRIRVATSYDPAHIERLIEEKLK